ncbi:Fur family peroxide stress response transcriptional regulator [Pullulanibacillus pueri]|uniref:FUR family transcriptional regulator n=1 Tax=Pullulanibacillus pueri TaxID=1437324 RepID=A0A8J2ZSL7_9BACL|nr:transcriptional repressor [Pullulanibacillus pueri]MBM7680337.1 Fur family peroxide stress response transcriptional regulator [Pullulanibacillus pueri]GGH75579.1 FUR family transcriptional regulator [Pullulanibacillus pueri]
MDSKVNLTPQRKAIYDVICESNNHPTAAEIIENLKENGFRFAYGTVYNSLHYLTEAGLIHELKLGEGSSRYDGNIDEHQHIQCEICGRVDEVFTEINGEWLEEIDKETGYTVKSHQVILKGVCPTCQNQ